MAGQAGLQHRGAGERFLHKLTGEGREIGVIDARHEAALSLGDGESGCAQRLRSRDVNDVRIDVLDGPRQLPPPAFERVKGGQALESGDREVEARGRCGGAANGEGASAPAEKTSREYRRDRDQS